MIKTKVVLYLSSGPTLIAECAEDEYESKYDKWESGKGVLDFDNCVVHVEDIIAIEYL
jgi:hypothetical protein